MNKKPRVIYDDDSNIIEVMNYLISLIFLPDHYVELDFGRL